MINEGQELIPTAHDVVNIAGNFYVRRPSENYQRNKENMYLIDYDNITSMDIAVASQLQILTTWFPIEENFDFLCLTGGVILQELCQYVEPVVIKTETPTKF